MSEDKHSSALGFTVPRTALFVALFAAIVVAWWVVGRGGQWPATSADHTDAAQVARGERVYHLHCARCHGPDLKGEEDWQVRKSDGTLPAPPHDASGHTWHHTDEQNFAYTKYGAAALGAGPDFKSGMPPFDGTLSDGEIWDALAYIESSWPEAIHQRRK